MVKGETGFDGKAEPSAEAAGLVVNITVYQEDGSTPRPYPVVKFTNNRTEESLTKTGNVLGIVSFTANIDLEEGTDQDDRIVVEQVRDNDDVELYLTSNLNATHPTWVEATNYTKTKIPLNGARFKINSTLYPEGRDITITKTSS